MPLGEDLRALVAKRYAAVVREAAAQVEQLTWQVEPERTGNMKQKTQALVAQDDGPILSVDITANTDYAGYTDAGTKGPYVIVPNRARVLVFEGAGGTVFTRRVVHPGIPGTQWFNGGVDGGDPMRSRWTQALELAMQAVGG